MKQHGISVDKTRRFTWKEVKELVRDTVMRSVRPIINDILNVVLMAYEDTDGKDIIAFQQNVCKYIADMEAFDDADLEVYLEFLQNERNKENEKQKENAS